VITRFVAAAVADIGRIGHRAQRVNAERERNYRNRQPRRPVSVGAQEIDYVPTDPDPPPF